MSKYLKEGTVNNANKLLLNNLFWIVPLNFLLIIGGITLGVVQREQSRKNQEIIKSDITFQIQNDSVFKKNKIPH